MSTSPSKPPPPPPHGYHDEKHYPGNEFEHVEQAKKKRPLTERNRCCRCLCCACCLPVWARYIVWFIIIGIIICIIVIGGLLGSFKMPTVDVTDITEYPGDNSSQITYDGRTFMFNLGLVVNIDNPNVLPIYLSDMQATATIPTDDGDSAYLGHGYLDKHKVPENSPDYNFTYPFSIEYDTFSSESQLMLNTLMEKCGLMGSEAEDITVNYNINLYARVLFVKLNLDLGGSATFGCPLTNGGLPGLSSMSLGDVFS